MRAVKERKKKIFNHKKLSETQKFIFFFLSITHQEDRIQHILGGYQITNFLKSTNWKKIILKKCTKIGRFNRNKEQKISDGAKPNKRSDM